MKEYKIVYQRNENIYVKNVKASSKREAIYTFYFNNRYADITKIEEVK